MNLKQTFELKPEIFLNNLIKHYTTWNSDGKIECYTHTYTHAYVYIFM